MANSNVLKKRLTVSVAFLTRSAIIAAIYFALSVAIQPLAFGAIQFRISELMTLLPIFMPAAIPGLTIGCFFTNFFFSPFGIYDMIFGTLATFLAAVCAYFLRRHITLAALPAMVFNAVLVPLIWVCDGSSAIYYIAMLEIFASEFIIVGLIGIPFTLVLKKTLYTSHIISPIGGKYKDVAPYYREMNDFDDVESD